MRSENPVTNVVVTLAKSVDLFALYGGFWYFLVHLLNKSVALRRRSLGSMGLYGMVGVHKMRV